MEMQELSLIDRKITSLQGLVIPPVVKLLNFHCNRLENLTGLPPLMHLLYLELSSNRLSSMKGVASLPQLRTLNLSCNRLVSIEGECLILFSLIDFSLHDFLKIWAKFTTLEARLSELHGTEYNLKCLELQGNKLSGLQSMCSSLKGLHSLSCLCVQKNSGSNPTCQVKGYRDAVFHALPFLQTLDGTDVMGKKSDNIMEELLLNALPPKEEYLEFLDSQMNRKPQPQPVEALVGALDIERERRWQAEQAARKVADEMNVLQVQSGQEHQLQSIALLTTDRHQMELKLAAMSREAELLRTLLQQQKDKVQQLQDFPNLSLFCRRKEFEGRVLLGGSEFQEAVARETAHVTKQHEQREQHSRNEVQVLKLQLQDLENEFRAALTIEGSRFYKLKEAFDGVKQELVKEQGALLETQQKERSAATMVQELTTLVREQKVRIAELSEAKQHVQTLLKNKHDVLQAMHEDLTQKNVQIESLGQEKKQTLAQLSAQESLIEGLRSERRIWGHELAQQGAALAQDRGRLDAQIEKLQFELAALTEQSEMDNESLKIKNKIVDDQTETIKKLKEVLKDNNERLRRVREEEFEARTRLQQQLDEEAAAVGDLEEQLLRLSERKEQLKCDLEDARAQIDEANRVHSAASRDWEGKARLLAQLEQKVKQMKDNFDARELKLVQERDQQVEAQR
uniref:Leucine rich repeat and coiled-coil centrosomal protein 1 n=1 Tax=Eptatretus burgeri TaxID=7764 RepID=A0A8C4QXU7_EPTBU